MALAIRASGIGKRYRLYGSPLSYLREVLTFRSRVCHQDFWALREIDLEIRQGDTLGVIGENGSGKTTLLKILSGVTRPTCGEIETKGKISALLELGSGFHPDYTGRENIYLGGSILDLSKREIEEKIEEVISFAGIDEFIDRPVKIYSTGMYLRLAFSIAIMVRPDTLITDEILSVGDESFQKKCLKKMESFLREDKTIVLCSHNLFQIKNICRRAIWLHQGKVMASGQVNHVVDEYIEFVRRKEEGEQNNREERVQAMFSSLYPVIKEVKILNHHDIETEEFHPEDTLNVEVIAENPSPSDESPSIGIAILFRNQAIYGVSTDMEEVEPLKIGSNLYRVRCQFSTLRLIPGKYVVRVHTLDHPGLRIYDTLEKKILIRGQTREEGFCLIPHRWI